VLSGKTCQAASMLPAIAIHSVATNSITRAPPPPEPLLRPGLVTRIICSRPACCLTPDKQMGPVCPPEPLLRPGLVTRIICSRPACCLTPDKQMTGPVCPDPEGREAQKGHEPFHLWLHPVLCEGRKGFRGHPSKKLDLLTPEEFGLAGYSPGYRRDERGVAGVCPAVHSVSHRCVCV